MLIAVSTVAAIALLGMVYVEFVRRREAREWRAEISLLRKENIAIRKQFEEIAYAQNNPFPDASSANKWLRNRKVRD